MNEGLGILGRGEEQRKRRWEKRRGRTEEMGIGEMGEEEIRREEEEKRMRRTEDKI
jgi:hypothetical protein